MKKIHLLSSIVLFSFSIFCASAQNYSQLGSDIDGETTDDGSGISVSLSEDGMTIAIGAWENDDNGTDAGHVRIYSWNGSTWIQKGADIDGEDATDKSGYTVSLSDDGSVVAIGAPYNDDGPGNLHGHTRIYDWNGSTWIQRGLDIGGAHSSSNSGWSVSLSGDGNIVAVGEINNEGGGLTSSGRVRVYEWNGNAWIQVGSDINGEAVDDHSGYSVSLSNDGTIVAIGAPDNDGIGVAAGHTRVYEWNGSDWMQRGSDIDGELAIDRSGITVCLSSDGSILAVGAYQNSNSGGASGHVRIYSWSGSSWIQVGTDIDGEAHNDQFGYSVSLSDDGATVAIGAPKNDNNGMDAGYARIYFWNGSSWIQEGTDFEGEAAGDESGYVSLSGDAKFLAIGAPKNAGNGNNSGHVRIYNNCSLSSNPVTNSTTLADTITAQCQISSLTAPTATDACGQTLIATHNIILPITTIGTTIITWTYTDAAGNSINQNQNAIVNCSIGIKENDLSGIRLFPNPTKDVMTLDLGVNYKSGYVSIVDITGQEVKTVDFAEKNKLTLSTQELTYGLYFIIVKTEKDQTIVKVIKE